MRRATLDLRRTTGPSWVWISPRHRPSFPRDLDVARVMAWADGDRFHEKQGRSTARFRVDEGGPPLTVYLKRFRQSAVGPRPGLTLNPDRPRSPAVLEWAQYRRVRSLELRVPDVVAVGERLTPGGVRESFFMVEELTGFLPLHEAIPEMAGSLGGPAFRSLKREVLEEMAAIVAMLHTARLFHRDLYLCHFFLKCDPATGDRAPLHLIDLHRLAERRLVPAIAMWKDLGQLLFSTEGVTGIDDRDRLRFWAAYRRATGLRAASWHRAIVARKAARYLSHNR